MNQVGRKILFEYGVPKIHYRVRFADLALSHLARIAFLAISIRRSRESARARAFPPFDAPSFASATAAGFFFFLCGEDMEMN